jgi:flagellar basal body-associated protein FliL
VSKKKRRGQRRSPSRQQKGSSLVIPIVVGIVVVAIVVGAILSIEKGQTASAELPGDGLAGGNTAQPLNTNSIPYPDVPRVSLQDAQDKLAQDQAILVDVRSRASYDKSHAAGAVSMPEEEITGRLAELPRDKDIILYCT